MNDPQNRILCSTGTMVGRENGYNLRRAVRVIADFCHKSLILGGEFMMLPYYYDRFDEVTDTVLSTGVPYPVIHCEKAVGTALSDAAALWDSGECDSAEKLFSETLDIFRLNCFFAERLCSEKMVLHLWGGRRSDAHIEYNIGVWGRLQTMAKDHGLELLIENVPSTTHSPLSNWLEVCRTYPEAGLIFDTRFATLHGQLEETLKNETVKKNLSHVHVSDFVGGYKDFSALRPILHPLEGVVDFNLCASLLSDMGYNGTVTLESPVMAGDNIDVAKLESSLRFIAKKF